LRPSSWAAELATASCEIFETQYVGLEDALAVVLRRGVHAAGRHHEAGLRVPEARHDPAGTERVDPDRCLEIETGHDRGGEVEHVVELLGGLRPVGPLEVDDRGPDARRLAALAGLPVGETRDAPDLVLLGEARRQGESNLPGRAGHQDPAAHDLRHVSVLRLAPFRCSSSDAPGRSRIGRPRDNPPRAGRARAPLGSRRESGGMPGNVPTSAPVTRAPAAEERNG
jgi:hypothetical protein